MVRETKNTKEMFPTWQGLAIETDFAGQGLHIEYMGFFGLGDCFSVVAFGLFI